MLNTIYKRFTNFREDSGYNKRELASVIGFHPTTISDIENNKIKPSQTLILKLAQKFNVNLHWMLTGEGSMYTKRDAVTDRRVSMDNKHREDGTLLRTWGEVITKTDVQEEDYVLPLLGQSVSAGKGMYTEGYNMVKNYIRVPEQIYKLGTNMAIMPVKGNSMSPTINDGDLLVCDPGDYDRDGIYIICIGDDVIVKRLARRPRGLLVISDNADYPAYEIPRSGGDNCQIISRIKATIKIQKV